MIAWLFKLAGTALFKYLIAPLAVAGALLGLYAWITTGAYDRGVAATEAKMADLIRKQVAEVQRRAEEFKAMPPAALDAEIYKMCIRHGGAEATCRKQP